VGCVLAYHRYNNGIRFFLTTTRYCAAARVRSPRVCAASHCAMHCARRRRPSTIQRGGRRRRWRGSKAPRAAAWPPVEASSETLWSTSAFEFRRAVGNWLWEDEMFAHLAGVARCATTSNFCEKTVRKKGSQVGSQLGGVKVLVSSQCFVQLTRVARLERA
jgi:hypothetical protein